MMHGAAMRVDASRARRLVRRLADIAGIRAAGEINATAAIRAAIARDERALEEMAERCDASLNAFATVAQVASMPLLTAVAQTLESRDANAWQRGYCPVCGAWPSLAELRHREGAAASLRLLQR